MSSKTGTVSNHQASAKTAKQLPIFLVVFLAILPLLLAAAYTSLELFRDLHDFTLSRREAIAFLVATTLKEKLDRTVDVGVSLSTRVQFQKLIEADKWDEAITILERVPRDFPYIDRASLFDPQGILKAATSPTAEIQSVIGNDFSYRDYYQGVSEKWEPFVAEAIKPAVPLGYNLVPVAIPIKTESQKILGVLLLNIKLDTVSAWSKNIDVGPAGFVYIVDHKGHLVAHPTLLPAEEIVDFSSVPSVQKVLRRERGVEVTFNPVENEKMVTAYEPVPQHGWGVIVAQPTRTAFVERNKAVGRMVAIWALVIFIVGFFTYRLLRDRNLIKSQRDRERLLLGSIGDGVVAIDRGWNITLWNRIAELMTGWTSREVVGKPFREVLKLYVENSRKENLTFIEEALLYKKVRFMEERTVLQRKDGTEIPVGDSAAPIIDQKGNVTGAIIVFRDISKEREAMELRSDFTYAAHQLRTPVTKAIWSIENALGEEERPEIRKRIEDAFYALKSVVRLNDQLLLVSQIDQGMVRPSFELVNLSTFTAEVLNVVSVEARAHNLTIRAPTVSPTIGMTTDPGLLHRALEELFDNAILYAEAKSAIDFRVSLQGDDVVFEVENTGVGIPVEQQPLIYTKFFRGSNYDTTRIVGAGLGLFISKRFLDLLGGKIWFASEEGKKTVFSVSLPLERKRE